MSQNEINKVKTLAEESELASASINRHSSSSNDSLLIKSEPFLGRISNLAMLPNALNIPILTTKTSSSTQIVITSKGTIFTTNVLTNSSPMTSTVSVSKSSGTTQPNASLVNGMPDLVVKFACSECGKTFKSKSSFEYHEKNKTACSQRTRPIEKDFKCDYCVKSFAKKRYLAQHVSGVHKKCCVALGKLGQYELSQNFEKGQNTEKIESGTDGASCAKTGANELSDDHLELNQTFTEEKRQLFSQRQHSTDSSTTHMNPNELFQ